MAVPTKLLEQSRLLKVHLKEKEGKRSVCASTHAFVYLA